MFKKFLLVLSLTATSISYAHLCPVTADVMHKKKWLAPEHWREAYHYRHPKKPIVFANASAYKRKDHFSVYCYYNGDHKNLKGYSTLVIMRDFPTDEVDFSADQWRTLYDGMHQCGTPDVTAANYPTDRDACEW